jgi:hypothetical protein
MAHLAEALHILKDFPPVPTNAWEAAIHIDLKGEDYNKKLVWNSDEGIVVRPYYRSEDIKDLESQIGKVPATFPFVRGRGSQSWKQGEVAADALAAWPAVPAQCILVCEAAGYQNVLVETVGVGQSEIEVSSMTDFFLLLMIPGAGDELATGARPAVC